MQTGADIGEAIDAFQRGDLNRALSLAEAEARAGGSPQWRHLLGLVHCRLGDPQAGAGHLRAAAEAEPGNVAYAVMLARALIDCGRPQEALDSSPRPSGTTPAELALWHARAEAADAVGQAELAAEAWGKLCAAGSNDWRMWSSFGNALAVAGRWPEAARAFRQAVELNPGELALRRSHASALARAGLHDESADVLLEWVEAAPADPENRILLARLLADLGRQEESMAQLDQAARLTTGQGFSEDGELLVAMARKPGSDQVDVGLLRELARLLERTSRLYPLRALLANAEALGIARDRLGYPAAAVALKDGNPDEARRLLLADSSDSDPVRWHWLMARIADSLGDSATAFAEAEAMNRNAPDFDAWRARASAHIAWVGELAERITADWSAAIRPAAPGTRRSPAFLVGFPRSGTTLLDTFLMGHPDTQVLEEVPLIHAVETALGKIDDLPERAPDEIVRARDAYFAELDRHVPNGFSGLAVDKLPLNLLAAPFLYATFPEAPVVFAQRHPCDCVLSCFMQGFALNDSMACFLDIRDAAAFYDRAMTAWTRARETLPMRVHSIVYEELVADPEAALRPLLAFLGLDWREELLDHRSTARARGAISTPSYDQVVQPLSSAASGRWRRYEKQLEPVLPLLLPWAEQLGYRE